MWYENYLIKQACIEKEAIFPLLGLPAYYAQRYWPQIKGGLQSAWQSVKANPIATPVNLAAGGAAGGAAGVAARNLQKPRTVPNFGANLMQVPQYPINEAANMQQAAAAQAVNRR